MKKVAIFGTFPPPIGGRSIHIKRLRRYLLESGLEVNIYSNSDENQNIPSMKIKPTRNIFFDIFKERYDLLHFHDRDFKLISFLIFFSKVFKYKTVLTYHSFRDDPEKYSLLKKLLFKFCVKHLDHIICVGDNESDKLSKYVNQEKLEVISSYLNPREDKEDFNSIPNEVWGFIKNANFLIAGNGNIRFHNNQDLYGLDLFIKLLFRLKEYGRKDIKLLFALLDVGSQGEKEKVYYQMLLKQIEELDLQDNIYIYEAKDTELYPLLKYTNLFIRPTNTDSFGISVAEALFYKIPTIASDVCKRAKGTILFKSRDIDNLYETVISVINNYDYYESEVSFIKVEDESQRIYDLYEID
jgi:glycosyltransferase involved in cell wall biosynthesis